MNQDFITVDYKSK